MRVFLSYPSEHYVSARAVTNFMRSVEVDCWLDKDSLVAGEDWDRARREALREANIVVILCAQQTVERNGVYQREINEALAYFADRRLGTLYIIPVLLEKASIPSELSRFQYISYTDSSWRRQLAVALVRATKECRQEVTPSLVVAAAPTDEGGTISRKIVEERTEGTYEVEWFEYANNEQYWLYVNSLIISNALGNLYTYRRQFQGRLRPNGSSWELSISDSYRRGNLISLSLAEYSYFSGAAHPNHGVSTINILGPEGGVVRAADVFDTSSQSLKFLTEYVNLDLRRQTLVEQYDIDISNYARDLGWALFDHFNFNEAGMQINLSGAAGLPHVLGYQQVYIPWDHVRHVLAPGVLKLLLP